ncbi:mandelate racemase/muconate lactonizing enzyme family protein [Martelella alba]|uniref:Mandelate racemase/muconate lactonizing enzyme family protein n=1 Tax=Martelella alba TaxID=2590451 RepID=A0ABY2SIK4_9HYPH|nr:mandelate racemase/muconate lactonizing enzyme family protein [Martelella alba]TKI03737.1 mandelate racemase/muconate lactonizing enzyme family protein [Martelella alba]
MKIRSVQAQAINIPFDDGGNKKVVTPTTWNSLEMVLVRVEDSDGNVGWGEAFGYFVSAATKAIIDNLLKPLLEGHEVESISDWSRAIQHKLHVYGRYGITMFAISGLDIALWDLWAKRHKAPLYSLLGADEKKMLPTYASLVGYNDPTVTPFQCQKAIDDGFINVKIHETDLAIITACHDHISKNSPSAQMAIDVNCSWSLQQAKEYLHIFENMKRISWLEEPIFPPEAFAVLAELRHFHVPLVAGENWCTEYQFQLALEYQAVDFIQPSVTKVGGITEFLKIAKNALLQHMEILPHCPYFGPGFLATLHLAKACCNIKDVEYLYVRPEADLFNYTSIRNGSLFMLSDRPGIGLEPDEVVISHYKIP